MATMTDIENCYRYILGRDMNSEEIESAAASTALWSGVTLAELRRTFLCSGEFHHRHLETLFENLVPKTIVVAYETQLGFKIYLDLRQLHLSFGVLNESYERREIDILRKLVPDDGVFFDVGANVGYFSLAVASRPGFRGRIYAYEPLEPLLALFRRSIAENGFHDIIRAHDVALANVAGVLPLTDAEHSINAGSTRLAIGGAGPGARQVKVDTLDEVAKELRPDVIKVDVEGAEGLFLHGGMNTIRRHQPTMIIEVNAELLRLTSGITASQLQVWLSGAGYGLWKIEPAGVCAVNPDTSLDAIVPATGVMNVLCVHSSRADAVRRRLPGDLG